jgi:enoyl-CoA hydratase/carnithine racemase
MSDATPGAGPKAESPADDAPVLVRQEAGIGFITLNRPAKRNNFSSEVLGLLREALDAFAADKSVRAIIIAAEGPVFSSGHNMKEFVGADRDAAGAVFAASSKLMADLQRLPKPVIAQVAGLASAAGCQLVASCDLVVAASTARFQTPGVMIGLFCSTPMVPLSRTVPPKIAMEMLLTGEPISAEEAERHGLVNRVVPPEKLEAETLALARQIIQYSGSTIALGKEAFYKQLPLDLDAAYEVGKEAITRNAMDPDGQEGMRAFLEKRPPKWRD